MRCRARKSGRRRDTCDTVPKLFETLRDAFGNELHLLHDAHHRLTPIEAARLGKDLEPYRLFWLEDAVAAELQEGFRLDPPAHDDAARRRRGLQHDLGHEDRSSRNSSSTMSASTSCMRAASPHLRRIFDFAAIYHVRTGLPRRHGHVAGRLGANLHLDLALPNFGIQEFSGYTEETLDVFPRAWSLRPTAICIPARPPATASTSTRTSPPSYPYQRAYLPVNRLEDGTLWHW